MERSNDRRSPRGRRVTRLPCDLAPTAVQFEAPGLSVGPDIPPNPQPPQGPRLRNYTRARPNPITWGPGLAIAGCRIASAPDDRSHAHSTSVMPRLGGSHPSGPHGRSAYVRLAPGVFRDPGHWARVGASAGSRHNADLAGSTPRAVPRRCESHHLTHRRQVGRIRSCQSHDPRRCSRL